MSGANPPLESPCGLAPGPPPSSTQLKLIGYAEAVAPYVAEFLGTFFVVFTVGCNTISGDRTWMPTSVSLCVMVAMYATASVSGGHLNPALSFAFGLAWKMKWPQIVGYMMAQILAGLLAGWLTTDLLDQPILVGPKNGFDWFDSMVVEVVFSSIYCFVGLNCMASLRNNPKSDRNQFFALAVGFVSVAGGHTTGQISGAFFNPAMTLGFGLTCGTVAERSFTLLYAGFQFTGAVVATILFFMVRPEELYVLGITGEGLSCRRACGALSLCSGPREKEDRVMGTISGSLSSTTLSSPDWSMSMDGTRTAPFPARVLSEFIGTYAIVFTSGLSTSMLSIERAMHGAIGGAVPLGGNQTGASIITENATIRDIGSAVGNATFMMQTEATVLPRGKFREVELSSTVAWATGAALMCMVYSLANVSGGHFNPAVTLANMCTSSCGGPGRRKCKPFEALFYILAQGGAGICAALSYVCVHQGHDKINPKRVLDLGPRPGYGWTSVAIGEAVFTGALALSVLCMTTVRDPRYPKAPGSRSFQFAWAIGMCFTASSFALEGISGGYLNPALGFGISVANFIYSGFHFGHRIQYFVHYVIYQAIGGLLAAIAFRLIHPLEYKEDPLLQ